MGDGRLPPKTGGTWKIETLATPSRMKVGTFPHSRGPFAATEYGPGPNFITENGPTLAGR